MKNETALSLRGIKGSRDHEFKKSREHLLRYTGGKTGPYAHFERSRTLSDRSSNHREFLYMTDVCSRIVQCSKEALIKWGLFCIEFS